MRKWTVAALAAVSAVALGVGLLVPGAMAQQQPAGKQQAGQAAVQGSAANPLAEGATEVFATMRDGVKLAGNLYLPQGKGPFPCIVVRTPYGKDEMYKDPRGAEGYQKAGYAFLVQDTRGKGHSEGF